MTSVIATTFDIGSSFDPDESDHVDGLKEGMAAFGAQFVMEFASGKKNALLRTFRNAKHNGNDLLYFAFIGADAVRLENPRRIDDVFSGQRGIEFTYTNSSGNPRQFYIIENEDDGNRRVMQVSIPSATDVEGYLGTTAQITDDLFDEAQGHDHPDNAPAREFLLASVLISRCR